MFELSTNAVLRAIACIVGFVVVFAALGSTLSHHLFIIMDSASNISFSQTVLWGLYAFMAIVALAIMLALKPHPLEALAVGALTAVGAGGLYCIGYANMLAVLAVAVVVGVVAFLVKFGPIRAVYLGVCIGLGVSLVTFCVSAASMAQMKDLTYYSSSTAKTTSVAEWRQMSSTQRENFLAAEVVSEAKYLQINTISVTEAILPKEIFATVTPEGCVIINYAAVRVACPDANTVARYEDNSGYSWVYESLTSPDDMVEAVAHAVAHVYQQERVAGTLTEQRTWPYEDANEVDGSNPTLDAWRSELPIDKWNDKYSASSTLESQAWGYASSRINAYVK